LPLYKLPLTCQPTLDEWTDVNELNKKPINQQTLWLDDVVVRASDS